MKRLGIGCLWLLGGLVLLVLGASILDETLPSFLRSSLPKSAWEIRESHDWSWRDFSRCLRARLPEADVKTYATRLGATEPASKELTFFWFDGVGEWWVNNPHQAIYQRPGSTASRNLLVGWRDGYVYVQDVSY